MTRKLLIDRIFFTAFLVAALMIAFAVIQGINTTVQLSNNPAQQIHDSGEEINPGSTAEARGLVAADLERRELVQQRWTALIIGGAGLTLLAVAWLASDFRKSRRTRQSTTDTPSTIEV